MSVVTRIRNSEELVVPFEPRAVWNVLIDVAHYPRWWPAGLRVHVLRDVVGTVGTEFEVRPWIGRSFRCRFEELEEPHGMRLRFFGGTLEGPGGFLLQTEGGATRVRYEIDVFARGDDVALLNRLVPLQKLHSLHMRSILQSLSKRVKALDKMAVRAAEHEAHEARIAAENAVRVVAEETARRQSEAQAAARRAAAKEKADRRAAEEARLRREEEEASRLAARIAAEREEARRRAEAEAARLAAEDARLRAIEEESARRKAAEEEAARRKAEQEAARVTAEAAERAAREAARVTAEREESRRRAEADAARLAEEEARRRAEAETARVAQEARRRAEAEAARLAEEEARRRTEAETARIAAEEVRRRTEEESARRKAAEEDAARRKAAAEAEAVRIAEAQAAERAEREAARIAAEREEARRRAEAETARLAAEEATRRAQAEAARVAEEDARLRAIEEESARRKAAEEEAARRKAEEEAARLAAEEATRRAQAEAARVAEEDARLRAIEEESARRKAAEEEAARRKAEEEAVRAAAAEAAEVAAREAARVTAEREESRRRAEAEAAQLAEEARHRAEAEAARLAEEEARRRAEAEAARLAAEAALRRTEAALRRTEEEEARRKIAEEDAARRKAAEEEAGKAAQEATDRAARETARLAAERDIQRLAAGQEAHRRAQQDEVTRKKATTSSAPREPRMEKDRRAESETPRTIEALSRGAASRPPIVAYPPRAESIHRRSFFGRVLDAIDQWFFETNTAPAPVERAAKPVPSSGTLGSNFDIAREYLGVLSSSASSNEVARFFTEDAVHIDHPNRFAGLSHRDLAAIRDARARDLDVFSFQSFELRGATGGGSQVAMEILWKAKVRRSVEPVREGDELEGRIAMFLKFKDGRIERMRTYRCFEPWSTPSERDAVLQERVSETALVPPGRVGPATGVPVEGSNFEIARRLLDALSTGANAEDIGAFYAADAMQEEFPNRLAPRGATRNVAALKEARRRGLALLSSETYELRGATGGGSQVALEIHWTGTVAQATGPFATGQRLEAHFGVFLKFRDGLIVRHRTYDCL